MIVGPIDFLALEFPGNKFDGSILTSILELVQAGVVRIIDLVVIMKDENGEVTSMISRNDIDSIAAQLDNNSTAGLLLFENVWAVKTKQAMLDANARLLMFERIPHEVVEENLLEIAEIAGSKA